MSNHTVPVPYPYPTDPVPTPVAECTAWHMVIKAKICTPSASMVATHLEADPAGLWFVTRYDTAGEPTRRFVPWGHIQQVKILEAVDTSTELF